MPTLGLAQSTAQPSPASPDDKWVDWSHITPRQWNTMWRSFVLDDEEGSVEEDQDHFFFERSNVDDPYLPANKYKVQLSIGAGDVAADPWTLSVSFIKLAQKHHYIDVPVCSQKLSLDRIPTRAALPDLDWQFKGDHQVHCTAKNREWFLEQYASIIGEIREALRPIDRSETMDFPNLDE